MGKSFLRDFGVYCCPHVFNNQRPVLLVVREADGDWQFLCGGDDHHDDVHYVGIGHLLDGDITLEAAADLPKQFVMERDEVGGPWRAFELEQPSE